MTTRTQPDQALADGLARLRQAIGSAADLAAQVERGHAQSPLRNHFGDLAARVDQTVLSVVLVAANPESRDAAFN